MQDLVILSGLVLSPLLALGVAALLRWPLAKRGRLGLRWCMAALLAGALCVQLIVWFTPEPMLGFGFPDLFELGVKTPLIEEGLKGLAVLLLCVTPAICDEVDGAAIGAFVGLGFAILENHRFFMIAPDLDILMMLYATRTVLATTGHALTTALVGAALGWLVTKRSPSRVAMLGMAFVVATALHGLQNAFGPVPSDWWFILVAVLQVGAFVALAAYNVRRADKLTAVTE